jgi:hypothetical protein
MESNSQLVPRFQLIKLSYGTPTNKVLKDIRVIKRKGYDRYKLEGFSTQTPTPLNRPRQPHQNFDDFSKSLEKSKNFIYYE